MLVSRIVRAGASWCSLSLLSCGLLLGVTGCDAPKPAAPPAGQAGAHDHDHEDLPMGNYAESVGSLRKLHDEIKSAFEAGKPDDGHHALHDIGHVLEAIEKQASTVAADKQEGVKAATKALLDGYGAIDGAMHDSKEVNYADTGADLAKHVETLEAAK